MKRKFFLHRQNEPMKSDTVVYRVWIGESVREQRILTQLMAWAFAEGATLRTWSEDIDYFLLLESERVFRESDLCNFGFVSSDLTASECLSLAQTKNWDLYENNLSTPNAYFFQMTTLAPSRLREVPCDTAISMCLPPQRKNLNQGASQMKHLIKFT